MNDVRKSNRKRISKFPKKPPQLDRSNPWKPKADILFNDEGRTQPFLPRKEMKQRCLPHVVALQRGSEECNHRKEANK